MGTSLSSNPLNSRFTFLAFFTFFVVQNLTIDSSCINSQCGKINIEGLTDQIEWNGRNGIDWKERNGLEGMERNGMK
jgi:hypothetical protein